MYGLGITSTGGPPTPVGENRIWPARSYGTSPPPTLTVKVNDEAAAAHPAGLDWRREAPPDLPCEKAGTMLDWANDHAIAAPRQLLASVAPGAGGAGRARWPDQPGGG